MDTQGIDFASPLIGLLCIAEELGVIKGWKVLGTIVALRQAGTNLYVRTPETEGVLHELIAHG